MSVSIAVSVSVSHINWSLWTPNPDVIVVLLSFRSDVYSPFSFLTFLSRFDWFRDSTLDSPASWQLCCLKVMAINSHATWWLPCYLTVLPLDSPASWEACHLTVISNIVMPLHNGSFRKEYDNLNFNCIFCLFFQNRSHSTTISGHFATPND